MLLGESDVKTWSICQQNSGPVDIKNGSFQQTFFEHLLCSSSSIISVAL